MRALASVGIFTEVSERCFALTPLATTLKSDIPGSMRYVAMAQMGEDHSLGWSNGLHSLRTGETAFDAVAGMSVWDYYAQHPEAGQVFSESMTGMLTTVSQAVAATYDFSKFNTKVVEYNSVGEKANISDSLTGVFNHEGIYPFPYSWLDFGCPI